WRPAFPLRISPDGPRGLVCGGTLWTPRRGGNPPGVNPVDRAVDRPVDNRVRRWTTRRGSVHHAVDSGWKRAPFPVLTCGNGNPEAVDQNCPVPIPSSVAPRLAAVAEAYDGGPVAALRRIGFLLERGRE